MKHLLASSRITSLCVNYPAYESIMVPYLVNLTLTKGGKIAYIGDDQDWGKSVVDNRCRVFMIHGQLKGPRYQRMMMEADLIVIDDSCITPWKLNTSSNQPLNSLRKMFLDRIYGMGKRCIYLCYSRMSQSMSQSISLSTSSLVLPIASSYISDLILTVTRDYIGKPSVEVKKSRNVMVKSEHIKGLFDAAYNNFVERSRDESREPLWRTWHR